MKHSRAIAVSGLFLAALFFASLLPMFSGQAPIPTGKSKFFGSQVQKYDPPTDPALYVGAETCKTCHEDKYKSYEETRHFATMLDTRKGLEWRGCEACHGPGKAHVDGGGDKSKIFRFREAPGRKASLRCLACHASGEDQANFLRSTHGKSDVGCLECNSVHKPVVEKALLRAPQATLCFRCHLEVKPEFSKPFHHRVNEGLISCGDCHNPHGGFDAQQIRSSAGQDTVCYKCHASKTGPFAFEHAVVKAEGCTACHSSHGSANPRLLKRSQINLLCLECHTTTAWSAVPEAPSFHNRAQKYQACTLCHPAIHGSNSDHFLMKP